jgi:hypothetical protein
METPAGFFNATEKGGSGFFVPSFYRKSTRMLLGIQNLLESAGGLEKPVSVGSGGPPPLKPFGLRPAARAAGAKNEKAFSFFAPQRRRDGCPEGVHQN